MPPAERELRAALAGATRDWLRGRVHKELGKLADLAGDRPRALDEYRLADRLCRQDHDADCSDEVEERCSKTPRTDSEDASMLARPQAARRRARGTRVDGRVSDLAPAVALRRPALAAKRSRPASTSDIRNRRRSSGIAADPRPEAERRQALFDFMYQTYEASAWIPQSLFDSNLVTQAVVGDVDTIVGEKVGLVLWRDNPRVPAFGMAPERRCRGSANRCKWTVNCLVCHTAEIDGVAYFGAGTKTFDELWLGEALKRLTSERVARPAATRLGGLRRSPRTPTGFSTAITTTRSIRSRAPARRRSRRRTSSCTCGRTTARCRRSTRSAAAT